MSERTYPENVSKNGENLNSKQIEENCRDMLFSELPPDQREALYIFTPEELKAYREALCREQREICAEAAMQCSGVLLREQARRAIQNAEEPE